MLRYYIRLRTYVFFKHLSLTVTTLVLFITRSYRKSWKSGHLYTAVNIEFNENWSIRV
jgi:hypothetical protein